MFPIHASFPAFHDCIKSISVMFVASNIITILEPICFSLTALNELTFPQREPGMEKVESQRCLFFCQRSTVEWHAATFQHGRQNKLFEVTEVDNFCVFDGAFHAKRLDHPVQLARNTGRTGVFGRNPASKQKKNIR